MECGSSWWFPVVYPANLRRFMGVFLSTIRVLALSYHKELDKTLKVGQWVEGKIYRTSGF